MSKTVEEIIAIGASVNIKIDPKDVYIGSNGTFNVTLKKRKHCIKFMNACIAFDAAKGLNSRIDTVDFDGVVPLKQWEKNILEEQFATRH